MNKKEAWDIAYEVKGLIDSTFDGDISMSYTMSPLHVLGNMPKVLADLKVVYEDAEQDKLDFIREYLRIQI